MSEYVLGTAKTTVGRLVLQIETVLSEPKSELNKRRIKNFFAEAKYHHIPLPALRALLQARRRLRLALKSVENLPPHIRLQLAQLAHAMGDSSELFQFEVASSEDSHLQQLRSSR